MPVTDEQVATLRAQLAGDFEEYERRWQQLDKEEAKTGYAALIAAAFFEAVDRRFATDCPISEVIEFVGTVRSNSERAAEQVDPYVAERLIRHSLGHGSIEDLDGSTIRITQLIVLAALVVDERYDGAGLDEFMAEVRSVAEEWTS